MNSLLVIDDDKILCSLLKQYLEPDGFEIDTVHNGVSGLNMAVSGTYSFVILDVMLPGIGGFEVLRRIRATSTVPVLMLSAKGTETDRILGLEAGADDYLPKPFNPHELNARIRAILRRIQQGNALKPDANTIEIGPLSIDVRARSVTVNNNDIDLTSVEFNLLEALMRVAGTVVSRDKLSKYALGRKVQLNDRALDIHISHLRQKLGDTACEDLIRTVRGVGYIFVVPRSTEAPVHG
jgi:DNA-binding response OmpR family regulator